MVPSSATCAEAVHYFSFQADLITRMPRKELQAVLIKRQHSVASNAKDYPLRLPRIMHEYVILWQRRGNITFGRPRDGSAEEKPAVVNNCKKLGPG